MFAWKPDVQDLSEILHIRLAKLQCKSLSINLRIQYPINFLLLVVKPESDCSYLSLKAPEEDKDEIQEAPATSSCC